MKLFIRLALLFFFLFSSNARGFSQTETDSISHFDSLTTKIINNTLKQHPDSASINATTVNKKSSFAVFPYAYYTPETKFAVGAGGMYIFYTSKTKKVSPSKIGFGGFYSSNKQYKISMNNTYYFLEDELYFNLPISYGFFINKYWGIGDVSNNYDSARYSIKTFATTLTVQVPPEWFIAERTGIILDFDHTTIVDNMGNEFLNNGSTVGDTGGMIFGIGTDLLWDSRDNIFSPTKGGYQYFKTIFYPGVSDYVYALFELDVRHFRSLGPNSVLAGNFYLQSTVGDVPFYKIPGLGGQNHMRGYFYGRYRDNFYSMAQLELRQHLFWRLGFVAFLGIGNVSNNIIDYNFGTIKYSYGGGLRVMFNEEEKVNLRVDFGIGSDGNHGIYFGIQEAF